MIRFVFPVFSNSFGPLMCVTSYPASNSALHHSSSLDALRFIGRFSFIRCGAWVACNEWFNVDYLLLLLHN